MSSNPETTYDRFLSNVEDTLGKIDIELALQVMLYERKMPDTYPMVELEIRYKEGVDIPRKIWYLREKYGFLVSAHEREVLARAGMSMAIIQEIAQDQQIEKITGSASVASY
jgi:inhibitor of KinA sporulation pathway (predicted exonuclease)